HPERETEARARTPRRRPTRNEGKPSRPARGARQQIDASGRLSLRVFLMRAILVALALPLAACSGAPSEPGVTATRVLEITGLQPVVNAVALSPNGSLVVVGDFDDDLIAREVPSGGERWKVRVQPGRERRRIDGVFFSPDASLVVTTGHEAQTLEVWDAATGRSVAVAGARAAILDDAVGRARGDVAGLARADPRRDTRRLERHL